LSQSNDPSSLDVLGEFRRTATGAGSLRFRLFRRCVDVSVMLVVSVVFPDNWTFTSTFPPFRFSNLLRIVREWREQQQ
jgi:hypothetical protein